MPLYTLDRVETCYFMSAIDRVFCADVRVKKKQMRDVSSVTRNRCAMGACNTADIVARDRGTKYVMK